MANTMSYVPVVINEEQEIKNALYELATKYFAKKGWYSFSFKAQNRLNLRLMKGDIEGTPFRTAYPHETTYSYRDLK